MHGKKLFTVLFADFDHVIYRELSVSSKEYKVVWDIKWSSSSSDGASVWELAVSLAHSWDTGPGALASCVLSYATTLYGFPIETIEHQRSEIWLLQITFSTGFLFFLNLASTNFDVEKIFPRVIFSYYIYLLNFQVTCSYSQILRSALKILEVSNWKIHEKQGPSTSIVRLFKDKRQRSIPSSFVNSTSNKHRRSEMYLLLNRIFERSIRWYTPFGRGGEGREYFFIPIELITCSSSEWRSEKRSRQSRWHIHETQVLNFIVSIDFLSKNIIPLRLSKRQRSEMCLMQIRIWTWI